MLLGALTQTAQAREECADEEIFADISYQKSHTSFPDSILVKYSYAKLYPNLSPEKLREIEETEPLTIAEMFREKRELERVISFEFAARYQEAAEHSMRTRDNTALNKIRQERDEIIAQKKKAWADGTFDKLAEAKRWAEYLRKRASDQKLVNYTIDVGKPPFPIDMSILEASEKSNLRSKTASSETIEDNSWLSVGRGPFDTFSPTPKRLESFRPESQLFDTSVPSWFITKPSSENQQHEPEKVEPTSKDQQSEDLLNSLPDSNKPHKQQDLEDLLSDLAEMEDKAQPAVTPALQTVMTETASPEATTPSVTTPEASLSEDELKQQAIEKDLEDILSSKHTSAPLPQQQDLLDALRELSGEDTPNPSANSAPSVAEQAPITPVVEKPVSQQQDLSDTLHELAEEDTPDPSTNSTPMVAEQTPITPAVNTPVPQQQDLLDALRELDKENTAVNHIIKEESENKDPGFPYDLVFLLGAIGLGFAGFKGFKKFRRNMTTAPMEDILQDLIQHPCPSTPAVPNNAFTPIMQPVVHDTLENNTNPTPAPLPIPQFSPIQHKENLTQDERDLLAKRLHAVRVMEDIKRHRYKLTRQMAKAKANNDQEEIRAIEERRNALKRLRKEAFATAAGPEFLKIKEERRLLTKKMTLARRKKDLKVMDDITLRRSELALQEKALKAVVRDFKYKKQRTDFLKPTLIAKMKPISSSKKENHHTRV